MLVSVRTTVANCPRGTHILTRWVRNERVPRRRWQRPPAPQLGEEVEKTFLSKQNAILPCVRMLCHLNKATPTKPHGIQEPELWRLSKSAVAQSPFSDRATLRGSSLLRECTPNHTELSASACFLRECLTDTPGAGVLFPFSSKDISPAEALDGVLSHLPPAGHPPSPPSPPSPPNGGFTICGNLPKTLESRDSNYSDTISIRTVPGS